MSNFIKLGVDNNKEIKEFQDLENEFIEKMENAFLAQMNLLFFDIERLSEQEIYNLITERLESSFSGIEEILTSAMIEFYMYGSKYTDSLISNVIPNFSTLELDIDEIKKYVEQSMSKIKETTRKRLFALLGMFLGGGFSIYWIIEQYKKSVISNRPNTIINYESIRIFNYAILDISIKSGFVINLVWITVGDDRVCHICKPRDGLIYPIQSSPDIPAHFGCRCRWGIVVDKRRIINVYLGF